MKFKLLEPKNEKGFLKNVEFNFEDLKLELSKSLEKFRNIIYRKEEIAEAKRDRASLNRFRDLIENERKRIKNLCLKPYIEFEKKIKILVSLIDEPISLIDSQIKTFEEEKREIKKLKIKNFYLDKIGNLANILSFEKLFDASWLNANVSLKTIQSELLSKIEKAKSDLDLIKSFKSRWEAELISTYLSGFSLQNSLNKKLWLDSMDKKAVMDMKKGKKVCEKKFLIKGTTMQLNKLKTFMVENEIEFEVIK